MKNLEFGNKNIWQKLKDKTFYIVLALCVAGAGTAAFIAVNSSLDSIKQENPENFIDQPDDDQNLDLAGIEDANQNASGVEKSPGGQDSQSSQSASSAGSENSANQKTLFVMPVNGEVINPYSNGELVKSKTLGDWRTHDGVDIKGDEGSQVKSTADGTVNKVFVDGLWGTTIHIEHSDGLVSVYSGLNQNTQVKDGDKVEAGTVIGSIGNTAEIEVALGPHLHFAMKQNDKFIDPLEKLNQ